VAGGEKLVESSTENTLGQEGTLVSKVDLRGWPIKPRMRDGMGSTHYGGEGKQWGQSKGIGVKWGQVEGGSLKTPEAVKP